MLLSRSSLAVCVFLCLASVALCQVNPVGSLDGEVRDSSSAVLTGTRVTLTNAGTNVKRWNLTNDQGVYYFNLLPPGEYRLEAERAGFRSFSQTVTVEAGRRIT